MSSDLPPESPRGDKMSTDFFEEVLLEYLDEDRIESGIVRLELDNGRTRRIVIDDDTESLDPYEYVLRELDELLFLMEEHHDLLDKPVELSIPVGDAEQVIEETEEEGAVTTLFQSSGIQTLIEHLRDTVAAEQLAAQEDETTED